MRLYYLAPLALLAGCQSATTTATNDVYALASTLTAAETAAVAYEHSASPDPAIVAQIKAAEELNTAAGRAAARKLQLQPIPPPAFNALFIGAFTPEELAEIATLLPYYSVNTPQVLLLGPALWANVATAMASKTVYNGAIYAAPDPAAAASFDAKYQTAYGSAPPAIADVGFDAAAIAGLLAADDYSVSALTSPAGFAGTDGVLQLGPDGQVQRGLAVFQVAPGGPVILSPAPATLAAPSS